MGERKPISHLVAGAIIALAVILFSVVVTLVGGANSGPSGGWVSYLIIIIGLVLFIQRYGKDVAHQASFGDYFSYGFKATTMIVLLFVIFLLVLSFAMPEIKQNVMDATRTELEKQKNVTDKDIERVMEMTNNYFWMIMIGTSVFFFALIGAIGSLIGAAITKKTPKTPFEQTGF